ncbi:MAG: helix-turn-helix transcriptional regulator [Thermoplasmata archaeon]|nr:MAG: helix-turn-helix transcriptional regulator [Thermoplasmata archaeon]
MNRQEVHRLFKMTMLIHKDKNIARILAATLRKPLSAQQISRICEIPPMQCYRTIRKLKEYGLIKVTKKVLANGRSDSSVFLYKADLDKRFIHFENGRFRVKFPAVFSLSNGKEIDFRTFFESYSSA